MILAQCAVILPGRRRKIRSTPWNPTGGQDCDTQNPQSCGWESPIESLDRCTAICALVGKHVDVELTFPRLWQHQPIAIVHVQTTMEGSSTLIDRISLIEPLGGAWMFRVVINGGVSPPIIILSWKLLPPRKGRQRDRFVGVVHEGRNHLRS